MSHCTNSVAICKASPPPHPIDASYIWRQSLSSFRKAGTDLAPGSCMISFITVPSLFLWFPVCDLQVDMAAFLFKSCCCCHRNEVQILRRLLDLFRTHDVTLTSVTYTNSILSGCPLTSPIYQKASFHFKRKLQVWAHKWSGYIIKQTYEFTPLFCRLHIGGNLCILRLWE